MPSQFTRISCRTLGVSSFLTLLLLLLAATPAAFGQWAAADAETAFSDFNNAFYFNPSGDNYDYRLLQGSTSYNGFWVQAELIEMADDAYNQNPTAANQTIINQLCNGFTAQYTANWSSDGYDDDLMWATIAFTRAAKATGNSAWLTEAETNFNVVWSRGYDTTLGGGIWWYAPAANTPSGYKNSAANWPFVIAGNLLFQATGSATYQTEAATIYSWAMSNLYNATTGEIYDGIHASGVSTGQYSYNYGVAIGANTFEKDAADANNMANYLMAHVSGGSVNGINILPNSGQGGTDGSGFNGITMRWVGYALNNGVLTNPAVLSWAQTNVGLGWALRNGSGLSWNDWFASTPPSGVYSWDCSDTLMGMLDVPVPTASATGFTLSASPSNVVLSPGGSGTSSIMVTPGSAFSGGAIALAASVVGNPAGVTATLGQTSVSGAASVTLNVSAASTVPGGNYVVAVTGTNGAVAETTFVQVGLPFFTLTVAPATTSLNQISLAADTVTVSPQNGFTGNVQFAVTSGLPTGVYPFFQPASSATSTKLTLLALPNAFTTPKATVSVTGTSSSFVSNASTTLSVSAATEPFGLGLPVDLSGAYNVTGIYPTGATYSTGGIDGLGNSYSSNLLGPGRVLNGTAFRFGPTGAPDVVNGAGQTIALPAGRFKALELMGTGLNDKQTAEPLVVTYTDGTTAQFSQNFSDWFSPTFNPDESEAVAMAFRNQAAGTQNNAQFNLYAYTLLLDSTKTVKSLTLPSDPNVVVLAATLTDQVFGKPVSLASSYDAIGVYTDGTTFSSTGGLDGGGYAYSANLLGDTTAPSTLVVNGDQFTLAVADANNAIYGDGTAIPLPAGHFSALHFLGTGVNGGATAQTVTVQYADGSVSTFTQSFSDWFGPKQYPGEAKGIQMAYRDTHSGTEGNGPLNLYEYTFQLNPGKTVQSLTLPSNRKVVVVGVTLANDFPLP